jgi:hypothetical protein
MRTAAVLAGYAAAVALGLYQTHGPMFDSRFARTQTERCDGMLNHYILEHSWQAVSNPAYPGTLSSPPCFYPEAHTLWYSEHLLGAAPVYWALRVVAPFDLAYQLWQVVLAPLNFVAFAAVVRWLRGPHVLAVLGGYLWAFALVHVDQVKHQQMIPRFWMPLAAYHAWAFALAPAARNLNRMLACVFLQSVTCFHTGWFLAAGLAVFLPLAVGLRPGGVRAVNDFARANRRRVLLVVFGWGAALVAAFVPYLAVNWGIGRAYWECEELTPTPAAWFTGPPGTRWDETLGPRATRRGEPPPGLRPWVSDECYLFCGFGLYAVLLAAALHLLLVRGGANRRPEYTLAAAALLTAAVWGLLAFAPWTGGPSAWRAVRLLPGGGAIRCVSRVYVTVYLFGTLGALAWLGAVTERIRPAFRTLLLAGIAGTIIFEQTGYDPPSFDKRNFYPVVDRAAEQLRGAELGYVVPRYTDAAGAVTDDLGGEVMAEWVGLRANVPVVNGYSGRWPRGDHPHCVPATDEQLRAWLSGRFRGRLTVVDPDHPDATRVLVIE